MISHLGVKMTNEHILYFNWRAILNDGDGRHGAVFFFPSFLHSIGVMMSMPIFETESKEWSLVRVSTPKGGEDYPIELSSGHSKILIIIRFVFLIF